MMSMQRSFMEITIQGHGEQIHMLLFLHANFLSQSGLFESISSDLI